ncbi:DUF1963 domain-containing protein [Streptomyces sp. NPDC047081]|uniref:DUF1963 domain-containing protein n=1 Tax=Streptomyces sp. NPDC047081 TaxID=3154706 RepID=UPI0033C6C68E
MTPEMRDRLSPFRDAAIEQGIPAEDVERWLTTARPCATLTRDGDGPVVGRFGGPLLLPADVPDPDRPFVASVDLTALPADATDLPLPPDGELLFFAFPETDYGGLGGVVYVPVGTAVTERDKLAWDPVGWAENEAMMEEFPQGPLRLKADVSLPCHGSVGGPSLVLSEPIPSHPRSEELAGLWEDIRDGIAPAGPLQIGGYADEEAIDLDPVASAVPWAVKAIKAAEAGRSDAPVSEDVADWVLLADWQTGMDVQGWESATVHWVIQREDLAARRFHRAFTSIFWNP